jgi:hypothetical protein
MIEKVKNKIDKKIIFEIEKIKKLTELIPNYK